MHDRIHGSLYGIMLGDALGMPVETMKRGEILRTLGPDGVTGFIDPMQTRNDDTKHMRAGDTTDDWQLARVVLDSLIACRGYDHAHMVVAHCDARKNSTFGWGKGSVLAVQDIIDGKRDGYSPPPRAPRVGLGNGVMMKIAPLALYHALRLKQSGADTEHIRSSERYATDVRSLGAITHSDPRAWIAAYAVGMFIVAALRGELDSHVSRRFWQHRVAETIHVVEALMVDNPDERVLATKLHDVHMHLDSAEALHERYGSGFTALETMPFVIGTFMRHPHDFRAGVLEAINAGGDTDTNASIVGALIGANIGATNIPGEWRDFRPEYQEAVTLGDRLAELFS